MMKNILKTRTLLLLQFVFLNLSGYSQNERTWNLRIVDYVNFSSSFPDKQNASAQYFKGFETYRLSNTIGICVVNSIRQKISVGSGLNFALLGDKSLLFPPDPMRGFLWSRKYRTTLFNAEIPFFIEYLPRPNFITQVGISGHYAFKRNLTISIGEETNQQEFKLATTKIFSDNFDASINIGIGMRKPISSKSILIMISSQFFLRQIKEISINYADYLPLRNFYSVGLSVGLNL
jgi:hypothetical protein